MRCAACKTTWHAEKSEEPIDLPLPQKTAPARPEELAAVKPAKLPGQYRAMVEDKKRIKELTAQGIVWGVMGAVVVLLLTVGYFLRVDIVRAFPRIAGAYAMVGLPVNATNLRIDDYTYDTVFKGGRFMVAVNVRITNLVNKPTTVPPVKIRLLDGSYQEFDTVIIPSGGLVVEPGATRTLTFDVKDPKNMIAHMELVFDLEGLKSSKSGSKSHGAGKGAHGGESHPAPASEDGGHEPGHQPAQEPAHEATDHDSGHAAADETATEPHGDAGHAELPVTPGLRMDAPPSDPDDHAQPKAHSGHG